LTGSHLAALALALVIDRLVGDPRWLWARLPHPVALAGSLIAALERRLNDPALGFSARRRRGVLALLALVVAAVALGLLVHGLLARLPGGLLVEALLASILLAQKSLIEHVRAVAEALRVSLQAGRSAVARIVGRDVSVLDEAGVSRAAIESAAENFSDGLLAPAVWFLLLGLPGLLAYKAVNTADSMIGHRSPRYEAFGWAAARLDDVLNWVPARLSALLIAAAAPLAGGDARRTWAVARRDARKHKSPNAGWPEAATAGALGLALGGPRRYGEVAVDGAWLGPEGRRDATPADIDAALRLVDHAWALLLALAAAAALIFWSAR
jgi:adenosylcobinamide-phosphate synthase